jgi:hypothetical protein
MNHRNLSVVLCLASVAASSAFGQNAVQLTRLEKTGVVVSGDARAIVVDVEGAKWTAQIDAPELQQKTLVELRAKAKGTFLQPGMYVRFNAKFDPRGRKLIEPIAHMTVFTPHPETRFGVFDGEPAGPVGGPRLGIAQQGGQVVIGVEPDRGPQRASPGGDKYVMGQIFKLKNSEITIQVPAGRFEGKLAEGLDIDVHVTDKTVAVTMLRPGDAVQLEGGYAQVGSLFTTRIAATLDRPLGEDLPAAKLPVKQPVRGDDEEKVAVPDDAAAPVPPDEAAPVADPPVAVGEPEKPARARILKVN